ncbi:hypothetical protein PMAYCL1PPCAC_18545 [Pristionchus mayeri]|uniref:GOLD domain-containing protein n=1 Tax=Pristionchus mayeri TaxID=1317129 RepID=A0AAN5CPR9_9BILA|nr:hypothetical protein PMAYCL1PPCAC_18545 [Pristionchus mayeri]
MIKMRFLPVLILILGVAYAGEYDFTVEVPAGKFQCYFQTVDNNKYKTLEIDYQVIDGGDLNINFMLMLGANVLAQETVKTDGSHKVELKESGDYQVCFDNSFSYQTRKVVFFEMFLFDEKGQLDEIDIARLGAQPDGGFVKKMEELGISIESFHASAQRIKNELNKVEYHQSLMRAHEARDRAIMGANLDRVTLWSIIHTLVLIGVGLIQVWMIRSLFESNSKMGKMLRN